MSREVLLALAKEAAGDYNALKRIRAQPDEELRNLGLDDGEILAIREGFFERLMALGVPLDGAPGGTAGCC